MNENFFISKAVALAAKGKFNTKPGVKVGSIIVKNQKIIGKGYYEGFGGPHAEINAINEVKKNTKKISSQNFLGAKYMSRWNLVAKKEKQEHALMSLRNTILKELLLAQKIQPKEA